MPHPLAECSIDIDMLRSRFPSATRCVRTRIASLLPRVALIRRCIGTSIRTPAHAASRASMPMTTRMSSDVSTGRDALTQLQHLNRSDTVKTVSAQECITVWNQLTSHTSGSNRVETIPYPSGKQSLDTLFAFILAKRGAVAELNSFVQNIKSHSPSISNARMLAFVVQKKSNPVPVVVRHLMHTVLPALIASTAPPFPNSATLSIIMSVFSHTDPSKHLSVVEQTWGTLTSAPFAIKPDARAMSAYLRILGAAGKLDRMCEVMQAFKLDSDVGSTLDGFDDDDSMSVIQTVMAATLNQSQPVDAFVLLRSLIGQMDVRYIVEICRGCENRSDHHTSIQIVESVAQLPDTSLLQLKVELSKWLPPLCASIASTPDSETAAAPMLLDLLKRFHSLTDSVPFNLSLQQSQSAFVASKLRQCLANQNVAAALTIYQQSKSDARAFASSNQILSVIASFDCGLHSELRWRDVKTISELCVGIGSDAAAQFLHRIIRNFVSDCADKQSVVSAAEIRFFTRLLSTASGVATPGVAVQFIRAIESLSPILGSLIDVRWVSALISAYSNLGQSAECDILVGQFAQFSSSPRLMASRIAALSKRISSTAVASFDQSMLLNQLQQLVNEMVEMVATKPEPLHLELEFSLQSLDSVSDLDLSLEVSADLDFVSEPNQPRFHHEIVGAFVSSIFCCIDIGRLDHAKKFIEQAQKLNVRLPDKIQSRYVEASLDAENIIGVANFLAATPLLCSETVAHMTRWLSKQSQQSNLLQFLDVLVRAHEQSGSEKWDESNSASVIQAFLRIAVPELFRPSVSNASATTLALRPESALAIASNIPSFVQRFHLVSSRLGSPIVNATIAIMLTQHNALKWSQFGVRIFETYVRNTFNRKGSSSNDSQALAKFDGTPLIKLDAETYAAVIRHCVTELGQPGVDCAEVTRRSLSYLEAMHAVGGYTADARLLVPLLLQLCKAKQVSAAERVFAQLLQSFSPTKQSVIESLDDSRVNLAALPHHRIPASDARSVDTCVQALVHAYVQQADRGQSNDRATAQNWLRRAERLVQLSQRSLRLKISASIYTALLDGYGRMLRSVPDLDRTWSSLLKESQKGRLLIDSRIYQASIRGYCRAGHSEKAWNLWNHAVKSFESGNHQPHVSIIDSHLCASVIFELNLARQPDKAQQIFQWMKSAGVRVDDRVRTALAAKPRHSVDKPLVKTAVRDL